MQSWFCPFGTARINLHACNRRSGGTVAARGYLCRAVSQRIAGGLTAAGQPRAKAGAAHRAELFLVAAVLLLGSAAVLAINQPATRRPLPTGVVFNQPLATAAARAGRANHQPNASAVQR